jgi:hypothetical protein
MEGVTGWGGNDLPPGHCRVRPRVAAVAANLPL